MQNFSTAIFLILTQASLGSANAEPSMATTSFWQAPYEQNQELYVTSSSFTLNAICQEYSELILSEGAASTLDRDDVDILRRNTDEISDEDFKIKFKIDQEKTQDSLAKSVARVNASIKGRQRNDKLPKFTQATENLSLEYSPSSHISYSPPGPLTAFSAKFGLHPLGIGVSGSNQHTVFIIKGKDSVCDFLSGSMTAHFQGRGQVMIGFQEQKHLDDFYQQVEVNTGEVFKAVESPKLRAALLGYRVGKLLESFEPQSVELTSLRIQSLFTNFFGPSMETNGNWNLFLESMSLSVPRAAQVNDFNNVLRAKQ